MTSELTDEAKVRFLESDKTFQILIDKPGPAWRLAVLRRVGPCTISCQLWEPRHSDTGQDYLRRGFWGCVYATLRDPSAALAQGWRPVGGQPLHR